MDGAATAAPGAHSNEPSLRPARIGIGYCDSSGQTNNLYQRAMGSSIVNETPTWLSIGRVVSQLIPWNDGELILLTWRNVQHFSNQSLLAVMHQLVHRPAKLGHRRLNVLIQQRITGLLNVTGSGATQLNLHTIRSQVNHPLHARMALS